MRVSPSAVAIAIMLFPRVAPAEPLAVKVNGQDVTLFGVDALTEPVLCRGQAARALALHRPTRLEIDPVAPAGSAYVFDDSGRLLNAVALEWGCAAVNAPSSAKRYQELLSANNTAQSANRGRYAPQTAEQSAAPRASASWYVPGEPGALGSWTGSGSKETETFTTTNREWRVRWAATPTSRFGGTLGILVYNDAGDLVASISSGDVDASRTDQSFVRGAPGRYYLKIVSANVNWRITAAQ